MRNFIRCDVSLSFTDGLFLFPTVRFMKTGKFLEVSMILFFFEIYACFNVGDYDEEIKNNNDELTSV